MSRLFPLTVFLALLLTACDASDITNSQNFRTRTTLTSVTSTSLTKTSSTKPPTTTTTEPQDSSPQTNTPEPNNPNDIATPAPAAAYEEPYFIRCFTQYPGFALWSDNSSRYSQWCADTIGVNTPGATGNSYNNTDDYGYDDDYDDDDYLESEPLPTFDPNSGDGYGPNQKLPPLCVRFPSEYGPC